MYIIAIIMILISAGLFIYAYKQWNSPWVRQEQDRMSPNWGKDVPADKNIFQLWSMWFGLGILAGAIWIILSVHSDYRPMKQKDIDRWEKQKENEK